jgi:hypothetical protein
MAMALPGQGVGVAWGGGKPGLLQQGMGMQVQMQPTNALAFAGVPQLQRSVQLLEMVRGVAQPPLERPASLSGQPTHT